MLVSQFIDRNIPVFAPDTATTAIVSEDFSATFPFASIVDNGSFIGFYALSNLEIDQESSLTIGECDLELVKHPLKLNQHIFEALPAFQKSGLPLLPVLNDELIYEGAISSENIVAGISALYGFQSDGGTIVLSIPAIQYSLAEISRLVEANQGKILSLLTESDPVLNQNYLIHLKINQADLSRIVATFERFEYNVLEVHQALEASSIDKDRFDQLMRYLGI
jgi:hypothetical protein